MAQLHLEELKAAREDVARLTGELATARARRRRIDQDDEDILTAALVFITVRR